MVALNWMRLDDIWVVQVGWRIKYLTFRWCFIGTRKQDILCRPKDEYFPSFDVCWLQEDPLCTYCRMSWELDSLSEGFFFNLIPLIEVTRKSYAAEAMA